MSSYVNVTISLLQSADLLNKIGCIVFRHSQGSPYKKHSAYLSVKLFNFELKFGGRTRPRTFVQVYLLLPSKRISRAWDMDFTLFYIPRSNFDIPLSDSNIPRSDSGAWDMKIKSMKHVHSYHPGRCTKNKVEPITYLATQSMFNTASKPVEGNLFH